MEKENLKCKICGKECTSIYSLTGHFSMKHKISTKSYYDKYFKRDDEGICPICGKSTNYASLTKGYNLYCSSKCVNNDPNKIIQMNNSRIETFMNKYGVDNASKIPQVRAKLSAINKLNSIERLEKAKQTNLNKYGVENPFQAEICKEKSEQTKLVRYGDKKYNNSNKIQDTIKQLMNDFATSNNCTSLADIEKEKGSRFRRYIQDNFNTIQDNILNTYWISNEYITVQVYNSI